jgi:hypothetical protein
VVRCFFILSVPRWILLIRSQFFLSRLISYEKLYEPPRYPKTSAPLPRSLKKKLILIVCAIMTTLSMSGPRRIGAPGEL